MRKFLKLFGYFLFFLLALVVFTPKESVYYLIEKELQPYGVVIDAQELEDNLFWLEVKDATIYVQGVDVAKVANLRITLLGFYNALEADGINLGGMAANFIPPKVVTLKVKYHLLYPLAVTLDADGAFGQAKAQLKLLDQNISLHLTPSKLMQQKYGSSLRMLKKQTNGGYEYEEAF
ncbi:MAG: hypothetical protein FAF05_00970 [Epsilonproteobacteria bacterium]|nr:hypothetical protein [Campylobacterota bacterium]